MLAVSAANTGLTFINNFTKQTQTVMFINKLRYLYLVEKWFLPCGGTALTHPKIIHKVMKFKGWRFIVHAWILLWTLWNTCGELHLSVKPTRGDAGDALRVAGAGPYVSRSPLHGVRSRGRSHKSSTNSELIIQETGDGEGGEPISRTCFPWEPRPYVKSKRLHVFPSFETRLCVAPRCRTSRARALATCTMLRQSKAPAVCPVSFHLAMPM